MMDLLTRPHIDLQLMAGEIAPLNELLQQITERKEEILNRPISNKI